jgi:hypothetical protein
MPRPIDFVAASQEIVERSHVLAHRAVRRHDARSRPGHDMIADNKALSRGKAKARWFVAWPGFRQRLARNFCLRSHRHRAGSQPSRNRNRWRHKPHCHWTGAQNHMRSLCPRTGRAPSHLIWCPLNRRNVKSHWKGARSPIAEEGRNYATGSIWPS